MLSRIRIARPSPALVISIMALFISLGGVGYAATGGTFVLGKSNAAGGQTALSSATSRRTLEVVNSGTQATSIPLALRGSTLRPPMAVNSRVRVPNLNADLLDGLHASSFLQTTASAADAQLLDGKDSSEFIEGAGGIVGKRLEVALDSYNQWATAAPSIQLGFTCPPAVLDRGTVSVTNNGADPVTIFTDNLVSGSPQYSSATLGSGGTFAGLGTDAGGGHVAVGILGPDFQLTIDVFASHTAGGCKMIMQSVRST